MNEERVRVASCELCQADRITPWFHEDHICWIAECEICETPMVVWRWHGADPPAGDRDHMLARLAEAAAAQLGDHWVIDGHMRQIPDHFHAHARRTRSIRSTTRLF